MDVHQKIKSRSARVWLQAGAVLSTLLLGAAATAAPLGIYVSQDKGVKVGDMVEVNLRGDLPAQPVDLYLYVIKDDTGAQSFYYEKKIHDPQDLARPWRAGISGPKLPETNPIFSFRVSVPGTYRVGVKAQPVGTRFTQEHVEESGFLVLEQGVRITPTVAASSAQLGPQTPDKNNATLSLNGPLGKDTNGNGIFDDVDKYIASNAKTPEQKIVMENLSKSLDHLLVASHAKKNINDIAMDFHKTTLCFLLVYVDRRAAYDAFRSLVIETIYPTERFATYLQARISESPYFMVPIKIDNKSCGLK